MREKGDHKCLSEDWLLENLPKGWRYDCCMGGDEIGFLIYPPMQGTEDQPVPLFIPLDLLVVDRQAASIERFFMSMR